MELAAVDLGKDNLGEDAVFRVVQEHEGGELVHLRPQLTNDQTPLGTCRPGIALGKGGDNEGITPTKT